MGASSSRKRKLTVENDESLSVITLSEDVVERLKGYQTHPSSHSKEMMQPTPGMPENGTPIPYPYFYFSAPITSLQFRQQKEECLKENDRYWAKRMESVEQQYGQFQETMQTEYNNIVQESLDSEKKYVQIKSPCEPLEKAVMECYKEHTREPMRCSSLVEQFTKCVDGYRANVLASRG